MKYFVAAVFSVVSALCSFGQIDFLQAYSGRNLPKGLLEAVAFTQTRMQVIDELTMPSCSGMPLPFGIMGLFENGSGYFHENARLVETLSGVSISVQKAHPQQQVNAYAIAFESMSETIRMSEGQMSRGMLIYKTLSAMSEIPDSGLVNLYARDAQVFEILRFMNDPEKALEYGFQVHSFDLKHIFGANYKILTSARIRLSDSGIFNELEERYEPSANKSIQYTPALWNPAPSCNFSSRNGIAVSAITIHTIQGSYSGAISWSQNCNSSVSYHYVIRSSDGQVTQMVDEADKAWHVGSENPYTIGYEHEGYVDNPSWYTEAMYNSSADLSRDIVNSGYGIPALRTYYGAPSSTVQVLGGCTKIKGHQHYPNQTHTDPGINWNWEKYYRLINNNPTINTMTSSNGNLYDSGGASGNYADDERLIWLIQPSGASNVTLTFSSFNVESGYDRMFIYDGASITAPLIGSYTGTASPPTISSSGGSLLIEFRSDCGTVAAGWAATYASTSSDDQDPATAINGGNVWKTEDFTATFTDTDNVGVIGRYYLVADMDPSNGKWSSNGDFGFCNELFGLDASLWTDVTGDFTYDSGTYTFNDINQQNSSTYTNVIQDNSTSYLYEWNQMITSTSTSQRAGLHFFCDDPTLPNRGNSYFVFFRETEQKAQIYKVTDDAFSLKTNDNCQVTANVNYNYKVTYNPQSGWIKVYANDVLVTQWQDIEPLQNGNSISLRTGGCSVVYDNIRVFRSRGTSVDVSVGPDMEMRYQSEDAMATGAMRSMVVDEMGNWSQGVSEIYLIDWTAPDLVFLHDGNASDIDTTYSSTLEANWQGEDVHSAIGHYEVAIGILPSLNNILNWTNVSLAEAFSHVLSSPVYDQVYTISLRMVNGAGLESLFVSDGQRLVNPTELNLSEELFDGITLYPNPARTAFNVSGLKDGMSVQIYDMHSRLVKNLENGNMTHCDVSGWASGVYQVVIRTTSRFIVKKLIID